MKFIRDIIGEKQTQSQDLPIPPTDRLEGDLEHGVEDEDWLRSPIDLAEGLQDDRSDWCAPSADSQSGDATVEPSEPRETPSRPVAAPEASVIRRALWPEELDMPENDAAPVPSSVEDPDEQVPEPPRFGRQAFLNALPDEPEAPEPVSSPAPPQGGRVKTRLLGFGGDMAFPADPIENSATTGSDANSGFPVGWLVIVSGPGRGTCYTLHSGVAQIGRGEGQAIRLDFGDTSISRENHAAIAFDPERGAFFIGHGGKANLVRCNDMPVLSTQELGAGDRIRVGETTLIFTPFCGPEFSWSAGA